MSRTTLTATSPLSAQTRQDCCHTPATLSDISIEGLADVIGIVAAGGIALVDESSSLAVTCRMDWAAAPIDGIADGNGFPAEHPDVDGVVMSAGDGFKRHEDRVVIRRRNRESCAGVGGEVVAGDLAVMPKGIDEIVERRLGRGLGGFRRLCGSGGRISGRGAVRSERGSSGRRSYPRRGRRQPGGLQHHPLGRQTRTPVPQGSRRQ